MHNIRRRTKEKPSAQTGGSRDGSVNHYDNSAAAALSSSRLPDVLPEDRSMTPRAPTAPSLPKPLFSSFNQTNSQTRRSVNQRLYISKLDAYKWLMRFVLTALTTGRWTCATRRNCAASGLPLMKVQHLTRSISVWHWADQGVFGCG